MKNLVKKSLGRKSLIPHIPQAHARRPVRTRPTLERLEDRLTPVMTPTDFWTGAAGTGLWSSGGNWVSGVAPVNGDTVVFETNLTTTAGGSTLNTSANAYNTVDDIANLQVAEIVFDDGTQYTVHTAGSDNPYALGGSAQSGTSGYTIGGTATIHLGSSAGVVVQDGVSGGNPGSLQETFGPGITINQDTATMFSTQDTGTQLVFNGAVTLNNFTLTADGAFTESNNIAPGGQGVAFNGVISQAGGPAGALALNGVVALTGPNTYTGTTTLGNVSGAIVEVGNNSGLGNAANTTVLTTGSGSGLNLDGVSVAQANLTFNSGNTLYSAFSSSTWNGPITLEGGTETLATIGSGSRLAINGAIGGGGALSVGGLDVPGVVELEQNNTYTGVTTVGDIFGGTVAGTLQIDAPAGLGAGGAGNGTTVDAGSSLLLDFASGGTLQDGGGNAEALALSGAGVNNAGALQTTGGGTVIIPGAITLNGVADVSVNSGTLVANGAVLNGSSKGDLIKLGAGTMVLANTSATASNYSGGTEIQGRILLDETATANTGLGTGNVQVGNNATLQLGYSPGTVGISIANNIIFEGVTPAAGADGSLEQLPSSVTLVVVDTITGNLQLLAAASSQVPIAVDGSDVLFLRGNIITPGGSGTGGGFVVNPPFGAGANPTGTLVLFGAASYGGTTTVDNGALNLAGSAGVVEVSGSALVVGSLAVVNMESNNKTAASVVVVIGPESILSLDGNQTFGALNITGGEVENTGAGVLTLNGDVTAAGFIDAQGNFDQASITGGFLALNASGGGNRNFTVNQPSPPPSTYEVDLAITAVVEDDSTGSGASGLTLLGNGVMSLHSGPGNTYTGLTTVQGGTLQVDDGQPQSSILVVPTAGASAAVDGMGIVNAVTFDTQTAGEAGATLSPGDGPAVCDFNAGNVTLDAGSTYHAQLNGTTPESDYNQLISSGTVNLGGATLDLGLGAVFSPGAAFTLIQAAAITGTFAGVPNGAVLSANGWKFQINYTPTIVTAAVVVNPTTENFTVEVAQINEPIQLQMVVQFPPGTTSVSGTFTFDYPAAGGDPEVTTIASFNPTTGQATGVVTVTGLPLGIVPIVGAFFGSYAGPVGGPVVLPPAPVPQVPIAQPQVAGTTIVLNADGSLIQLTPNTATTQTLSPAGTIVSVSVVSANGGPVVFAITANGNGLWEYSSSGWGQISVASFQQISAATDAAGNAVVFGILGAGAGPLADSLWQYVGGVWSEASAGSFQEVSAAATSAGPVAFAIVNGSHNLWEHLSNGVWNMASAGSFQQVSAGINAAGQAVAYGVVTDNSLWEFNPATPGLWTMLSGAGTILGVSAGGPDTAFAITAGGSNLWRHNDAGWSQTSSGSFTQLSTSAALAQQDELFATLTGGSLWAYADNTLWNQVLNADALFSSTP